MMPVVTQAGSYVDHPGGVALLQVVEHGGLVEVGQHGHVLNLIVLRRVHGLQVIQLNHHNLAELWWFRKGKNKTNMKNLLL